MSAQASTEPQVVIVGAGQAGLASAYYLQRENIPFLMLEASGQAAGSWAEYYDSLVLFSPAQYSSLPGFPFPGPPDRYPTRDEVVSYLTAYAQKFAFPIRFQSKVVTVQRDKNGFVLKTADGTSHRARAIIAATGSFSHPSIPKIPGSDSYRGQLIHAIAYRSPSAYHGKRVVVVGAGNTAIQIAVELAQVAHVTLATRESIRYLPQRILGKDVHWWFKLTHIDEASWFSDQGTPVLDDGTYRKAIRRGKPSRRPMFQSFFADGLVWPDGTREPVDAVIYGTGYRSTADYLAELRSLDKDGLIVQERGLSLSVPGLYFIGFSKQRNFASATLRGVGPDAAYILPRLKRFLSFPN